MERAPTRRPVLWALVALLVAVPAAQPQEAEVPGLTVTAAGGWSFDGDLTPGLTGVNTVLEPGWVAALQLEHYFGTGLFGLRLAGAYTARELDDGSGKFDVGTAELGGVIRPPILPSAPALEPFLSVTAGATMYKAVSGSPTFAEGRFGPDPVFRGHVTVGGGMDVLIVPQLAVRLEGGDRITFPSLGFSPHSDGFPIAHTPVAILGLQYRFGVGAPGAPPARRPAPEEAEPEPEPQPQPVEEPEAEPEPAPEPPPAEAEPAAEAPTFTVQVGTFLTPATARRWGERITGHGIPVWYLDRQLGGTDVSRVRAGAASTEAQAREIAAFITAEYGWETAVESIGPNEPVPTDALTGTLEFLESR